MADEAGTVRLSSLPELEVWTDPGICVATLRYFDARGPFAAALSAATGSDLPEPCLAKAVGPAGADGEPGLILAWLRPTETLLLSTDAVQLAQLARRLAGTAGGCLIDLTGGMCVVRVAGARASDLLFRLGRSAGAPRVGEAWRGRLAEVPVLALSVRAGEALLAVDRAFAEHLLEWIRETLADWAAA